MNERKLHTLIYKGATQLGNNPCDVCYDEKKQITYTRNIRQHFHGSEVGKCKRAIYYDMHNRNKKIENGLTSMFLFAGHLFEAMIVRCLELSGEEIKSISSNNGADLSVKVEKSIWVSPTNKVQVKIIGHYDVVINDEILLEIKAVKTNSFKDVFLKGDLKNRQQYYGQVQTYLHAMPHIKYAYLIGIHRESCEIAPPILIKRDAAFMDKKLDDYAKVLHFGINQNQLPTTDHENKNDYECRFCDYKKHCIDNKLASEIDFNV